MTNPRINVMANLGDLSLVTQRRWHNPCIPAGAIDSSGNYHYAASYQDGEPGTTRYTSVFSGDGALWSVRTVPADASPDIGGSQPSLCVSGSTVYVATIELHEVGGYNSERAVLYKSTGGAFSYVGILYEYDGLGAHDAEWVNGVRMHADSAGTVHCLMPVLERIGSTSGWILTAETARYCTITSGTINASSQIFSTTVSYPYWEFGYGSTVGDAMVLTVNGTTPTVYGRARYRTGGSTYTKSAIFRYVGPGWASTSLYEDSLESGTLRMSGAQLDDGSVHLVTNHSSSATWMPGITLYTPEDAGYTRLVTSPWASASHSEWADVVLSPSTTGSLLTLGWIYDLHVGRFNYDRTADGSATTYTIPYYLGIFTWNAPSGRYPSTQVVDSFVRFAWRTSSPGSQYSSLPSLVRAPYVAPPSAKGDPTVAKVHPALELIRNLEMQVDGRFYMSKNGNAVYESRYGRSG